jgi:hypothetical protein
VGRKLSGSPFRRGLDLELTLSRSQTQMICGALRVVLIFLSFTGIHSGRIFARCVDVNVQQKNQEKTPMDAEAKRIHDLGNLAIKIDKATMKLITDSADPAASESMQLIVKAAGMCALFRTMADLRIARMSDDEDKRVIFTSAMIIGLQIGMNVASADLGPIQ